MPGIKRRRLGVALTLAAALLSHPVRAADHYDLHFIISLTGSGAFLAKSEQQAIGTAAQLINRNGGIHGKTLVPVFHDDQSSPQVAVQLVSEVLSLHPAVIIGSTSAPYVQFGQFLQANLKQSGINMDLQLVDTSTVISRLYGDGNVASAPIATSDATANTP